MTEHLIVASLAVLLFALLRKRIHIHVHYKSHGESRKGRRSHGVSKGHKLLPQFASGQGKPGPVNLGGGKQAPVERDLASALINLGCNKEKARAVAQKVANEQHGQFTELLRVAIKEAA